ncbi:hypothetical protein NDU88_005688 [Pleurodeles waltl]|uniref:Uncharacterized protein n=1 Tax=Pleurodeles waltl TaxID=8319 RepID=A0AAV7MDR0_PLEWA|nr:hypothetical protein NDU88_005688 [Pleurodeles waltl]
MMATCPALMTLLAAPFPSAVTRGPGESGWAPGHGQQQQSDPLGIQPPRRTGDSEHGALSSAEKPHKETGLSIAQSKLEELLDLHVSTGASVHNLKTGRSPEGMAWLGRSPSTGQLLGG